MSSRIVYIKVPVLIDCNSTNAESKVIEKFGSNIFVEIDYRKDLTTRDIIITLLNQNEIIKKIKQ